ncbi:hypothetical protein, partial [Aureibaculum marinum]|uniref:hypothetical protein n=1 Tax=Aureibaculum marinum TaxID=2487930 RepID=UPI0011CE842A
MNKFLEIKGLRLALSLLLILQHETMAALYIHSMKDALKDFHKNVLTTDYLKFVEYYGEAPADKFYEALAWQG